MYATWFDYGSITNMGTKKGVLRYTVPSYATNIGYWDIAWVSSAGVNKRDGGLYRGSDESKITALGGVVSGARPALYH